MKKYQKNAKKLIL